MSTYVKSVERYVKAHAGEKITLKALSENAYLSMYHFAREFKKEAGITPKQYVIQLKMDDAECMLVNSEKKIGEIAEAIGYEPGRFCNLFKEVKGYTPSAYREHCHPAENAAAATA